MALVAGLLPAPPAWRGVRAVAVASVVVAALASVLRPKSCCSRRRSWAWSCSILCLQQVFALQGAVVHGLPVAGLSPGLELLGQAWANGAGAVRDGGGRAGRGMVMPGRK